MEWVWTGWRGGEVETKEKNGKKEEEKIKEMEKEKKEIKKR
jgi:hypothetical protein